MLFIVSCFVTAFILIISIYFVYGRFISNNRRSTDSNHTTEKVLVEVNLPSCKKNKNSKNSQKNTVECKATNDVEEVSEASSDINLTQENIIEPVFNKFQETGNMTCSDVENTLLNNENLAVIDDLKSQIKNFETENWKLKKELEETNEKVTKCNDEAESLAEENKNNKTKLTKLEHFKTKTEKQIKKAEKSHSDSLAKNDELERKLNQSHNDFDHLKKELDSYFNRLNNSEAELKSEQEKLRLIQSEKDSVIIKCEEIVKINKMDNLNHIEMYHQYESKIEQLNADKKQMKIETVNLNNALQEKEKNFVQLNGQLKQLNIYLSKSKEENSELSSTLKELHEKLTQASQFEIENRQLSKIVESLKTEISFKQGEFESKIQQMSTEQVIQREESNKLRKEILADLELKRDEIAKNKKLNSDLLIMKDDLKMKLSSKTDEFELKIQTITEQCKEKDSNFIEMTHKNLKLQNDIERLKQEFNENINDKSNLSVEIDNLKKDKDEVIKELKVQSNILKDLQDQKINLLKEVEQLKKEISDRDCTVKELSNTITENDNVIKKLLNEKKVLENKLDNLKSSMKKEVENRNSIQLDEISKQLKKENDELLTLRNEKVILSNKINQLMSELKEKDENSKHQMSNLEENLERKVQELNSINEKCEKLEKGFNDSIVLNSNQPQIVENNFTIEEIIQKTRQNQEFQECQPLNDTNDFRAREELQSHIDKLESELLVLQRKYYELKNISLTPNDGQELSQKTVSNINICQSGVISIPSTFVTNDTETTIDVLTDKSQSHSHLLDSIEKLNIEISEQRLKNQTLDKQMIDKNIEVNALKQCLLGLDGDLLSIEHLALDLQKLFSESSSEKNRLKTEYNQILKDNELINTKYDTLVKEFNVLKNSSKTQDNSETIKLLEDQLKKCQDDNCQLKIQLDHYRETLEKTENYLQNIQTSVDQENNWKICLKSSEQEQERLEEKIKELLNQIDELKNKKHSDSSAMISMETPSIANGSLSSEIQKKRKRKNKKKKNKNHVTQP